MKAASLLQALFLTLADFFLLWKYDISASSLLLVIVSTIALVAIGLSFTLNSCFIKIAVCGGVSATAVTIDGFSISTCIIFCCLAIHSASLWCETERAAGSSRWQTHFKLIHRMRHHWLGSLSLYSAIGFCYVILNDYFMFSSAVNMILLTAVPLISVMYAEVNRVHNQNAFWVEVSGPLSGSSYYWKIMLLATGVLFLATWSFNEVGVEKIIEVREMLEDEEENDTDTNINNNRRRSGFQAGQITLSPKVDIELTDNPEFMIKFTDSVNDRRFQRTPFYVTVQNLVNYSANTWRPAITEGRIITDLSDRKDDGKITVRRYRGANVEYMVYMLNPQDNYLYSLTGLHTVHLSRMVISSTGSLGILNGDPSSLKKYRLESSYYNFEEIKGNSLTSISRNNTEHTQLPDSTLIRKITALTNRLVRASDSLSTKISKIKNYLDNQCTYSLKVENPDNRVPLDNFLFYEKKGHCVLYSSAFTLMLRSQGIPARLVNGFAGGEYDRKNKLFLVKGKNAHAWTEIYLDRYGGIVCDPTPEAVNIQPGTTALKNFSEDNFRALEKEPEVQVADNENSSSFIEDKMLFILIITAVLISFFWQYIKKIKTLTFLGDRKKSKTSPRPQFIISFFEYCRNRGVKIRKSSTVRELSTELAKNNDSADFNEMVDYYYAVKYAESPRDEGQERQWQIFLDKKNKDFTEL